MGRLVEEGKAQGHFSDELIEAMADMIQQRWKRDHEPAWICRSLTQSSWC